MMQGAGYAGDACTFNALFKLIEDSNQMTELGYVQAVWIKLFSTDEKIKETKAALQLVQKYASKFNDDIEAQSCAGCAFAVNDQMGKAKSIFGKIDKAKAMTGKSQRYERLKELLK